MMENHQNEPEVPLRVSVVVPCFNEEEAIETLVSELVASLSPANGFEAQVIVIDDGSSDGTWALLQKIQNDFRSGSSRITFEPIRNRTNFGKLIAQMNGLAVCDAPDFVVLLDGDGQHNPATIPEMIQLSLDSGLPVSGRRVGYKRTFFGGLFGVLFAFALKALGSKFSLEESEFLVLPGWTTSEICNHPLAGAAPIIPLVKSSGDDILLYDTQVRKNQRRVSRFGVKDLWEKGIAELLANPPQILSRVFFLFLALTFFIAGYGLFVGLSSILAGEYSGIGSVILIQSMMFFLSTGLGLLIFGTIAQLIRASHFRSLPNHSRDLRRQGNR